MPAIHTDLTIEQGADWSYGWAVTFNGAPIDDTWTARSQIRRKVESDTITHTFAATVDTEGHVVIAVTAAESSEWDWRTAVYDVEVVNSDESITLRVAKGSVTVDAEVTR